MVYFGLFNVNLFFIILFLIFEKLTDKFENILNGIGFRKYVDDEKKVVTSKFNSLRLLFVLPIFLTLNDVYFLSQNFYFSLVIFSFQLLLLSGYLWFNSNKYDQTIELIDNQKKTRNLSLSKLVPVNGIIIISFTWFYNVTIFNNVLTIVILLVNILYIFLEVIIMYPDLLFDFISNNLSFDIFQLKNYIIFEIILVMLLSVPLFSLVV